MLKKMEGIMRFIQHFATLGLAWGILVPSFPALAGQPDKPTRDAGICTLTHCDSYQSGALQVRGPRAKSHVLSEQEIDLLWEPPVSAGAFDRRYADGTLAFWVIKVDRIEKLALRNNTLTVLQELRLPMDKYAYYSGDDMKRFVAEMDRHSVDSPEFRKLAMFWKGYELEGLRAFYGLLARDGTLYAGMKDRVVAFGDADPRRADSAIVRKGEFVFDPAQMNKAMPVPVPIIIGFNVLPDGHLAVVSMDGTLVVISPDLRHAEYHRIGDETIWNSLAVDEKGGMYFASSKKLYKRVWKDGRISDSAADGAWEEPYDVGPRDASHRGARGSGSTPALMGERKDRERFVIISDAADINNAVLFWRDGVPDDWPGLPGLSRRIAGKLPIDFGEKDRVESYSESAAAVLGYGAVFADGRPKTGEQITFDVMLRLTDPKVTPTGLQKFRWDAGRRRFVADWVRTDASMSGATPVISAKDRGLHFAAVVNRHWTWTVLDWTTGKTRAVYDLGPSQRHNPNYIVQQLLPNGDPLYAGFGGFVHLRLNPPLR